MENGICWVHDGNLILDSRPPSGLAPNVPLKGESLKVERLVVDPFNVRSGGSAF